LNLALQFLRVISGALLGVVMNLRKRFPRASLFHLGASRVGPRQALPSQGAQGWLSLVPVDAAQSSYNGLILLVFILVSATLVALFVHRLGSRASRIGRAWDCGFPEPVPLGQYSASSFAQPLRRVFGEVLFRARDHVDMPASGELRPARLTVTWHDLIWDWLYRPTAALVERIADRLNFLQYLTVRRYLTMMFGALVSLLGVVALWR
jgi:hypothetical protein